MDWLRREQAPFTRKVWQAIDEAVVVAARHVVAGRRVADFDGPKGWEHIAVRLGTSRSLPESGETGVQMALPEVVLLTELRSEFSLPWLVIEAYERGGPVLDTATAEAAARALALAEDRLVFYGRDGADGLLTSSNSPHSPLSKWDEAGKADLDILRAAEKLDKLGIAGPYDLVLDEGYYFDFYGAVSRGGGYPVSKQVKEVVKRIYRSQVIKGGALVSTRGGDFVLTVGGDLTVGYRSHDQEGVHLFCVESLATQVLTPQAVCLLDRT